MDALAADFWRNFGWIFGGISAGFLEEFRLDFLLQFWLGILVGFFTSILVGLFGSYSPLVGCVELRWDWQSPLMKILSIQGISGPFRWIRGLIFGSQLIFGGISVGFLVGIFAGIFD